MGDQEHEVDADSNPTTIHVPGNCPHQVWAQEWAVVPGQCRDPGPVPQIPLTGTGTKVCVTSGTGTNFRGNVPHSCPAGQAAPGQKLRDYLVPSLAYLCLSQSYNVIYNTYFSNSISYDVNLNMVFRFLTHMKNHWYSFGAFLAEKC